jgi:hypothetical protein
MSSSHTGEFTQAMRAGDWDRAQRLLAQLPAALPDHMLRSIAELHMLRERWSQGAQTLALMKHRNSDAEMRRKLCANLAAMRTHRPAVYKALVEADHSERYSVAPSKTGHPTIFLQAEPGRRISMSADNDPMGAAGKAMASVEPAHREGKTLGLTGIGDGYLLAHLAQNPPKLILGREQAVCLIEPDPHLLLACLMLHDYTGPEGPIEQGRFSWYVGGGWVMQFRDEFFGDLFKMYPTLTIRTGLQASAIEEELAKFLSDISDLDRRLASETSEYYSRLKREDLLVLLGENPPRQPRVLVLTTRFSTVLQYSSADTADAFSRLGWEAHVVIEPSSWHGLNRIALREAVCRFKPDLIFQIDHLRSEYGTLFPANVPAVCWIQDHLPNLMDTKAGGSITLRDFVLTASEQMYHEKYGYPLRQCIYLNKATRVPPVPADYTQDGPTMVFVSNCSHDPKEVGDKLADRIENRAVGELVRDFCGRTIDRYARGENIGTMADLREALDAVERDHNLRVGPDSRDKLLHALWHPFNDTLYRQQALRWAANAADSMGLSLALYGNGWENNREFARFAKGYAGYGLELENLTRRSLINLQIVPFSCFHQRLLDGLVCGGFFLIREHPVNRIPAELTAFVEQNFDRSIRTTDAALASVSSELRPRFEELLSQYRRLNDQPDPVLRVRMFKERAMLKKLPRLDEVCFSDETTLHQRLEGFARNQEERRAVAGEQRDFVERLFTYEAHMKRVISEICGLITSEPQISQLAA